MRAGQTQLGGNYTSQGASSAQALQAAPHPPNPEGLPLTDGFAHAVSSVDGAGCGLQSIRLAGAGTSLASAFLGPNGQVIAKADVAKMITTIYSAPSAGQIANIKPSQPVPGLKRSIAEAWTPSANSEPPRAHQLRRLGSQQADGGSNISSPADTSATGRPHSRPSPRLQPRHPLCQQHDPEPTRRPEAPLLLLGLAANALIGIESSAATAAATAPAPQAAAAAAACTETHASLLPTSSASGIECLLTAALRMTGTQLPDHDSAPTANPREPPAGTASPPLPAAATAAVAASAAPRPWDGVLPTNAAPPRHQPQSRAMASAAQPLAVPHRRRPSATVAAGAVDVGRGRGAAGPGSGPRRAATAAANGPGSSTASGSASDASLTRTSSGRDASGSGGWHAGGGGGAHRSKGAEGSGSGVGSGRSGAIATRSNGRSGGGDGGGGGDVGGDGGGGGGPPALQLQGGPGGPGTSSGWTPSQHPAVPIAPTCTTLTSAIAAAAATATNAVCFGTRRKAAEMEEEAQEARLPHKLRAGSAGRAVDTADPVVAPSTACVAAGSAPSADREVLAGHGQEPEQGGGGQPGDNPSTPPGTLLPELPPELAVRLKKKVTIIQPISRAWEEETLQSSNGTTGNNASASVSCGCGSTPAGGSGVAAVGAAAATATAIASANKAAVGLESRASVRPPAMAAAGRYPRNPPSASDPPTGSDADVILTSGSDAVAALGPLQRQESLVSGLTTVAGPGAPPRDGGGVREPAQGPGPGRGQGPSPPAVTASGALGGVSTAACMQPATAAPAAPAACARLRTPPEAMVAATAAAAGVAPSAIPPHVMRELSALAAVATAYGHPGQQLPSAPQQLLLGPQAGLRAHLPHLPADAAKLGGLPGSVSDAARRSAAPTADAASPFNVSALGLAASQVPVATGGAGAGSFLLLRNSSGTSTGVTASTAAAASTGDTAPAPAPAPAPFAGVVDVSPFGSLFLVPRGSSGTVASAAFLDDRPPLTAAGAPPAASALRGGGGIITGGTAGFPSQISGGGGGGSSIAAADCRADTRGKGSQPAVVAAAAAAASTAPALSGRGQHPQSTACLGKVQGELTLLYQWYAANKRVYLDQAQRQLQRIEVLTAAVTKQDGAGGGVAAAAAVGGAAPVGEDALAASVRAESAEALRAFETALRIMSVCDNVEQQWLMPADGDWQPQPPPQLQQQPQLPGAAAAAAHRPQAASAAPSGAMAAAAGVKAAAAAGQSAAGDAAAAASLAPGGVVGAAPLSLPGNVPPTFTGLTPGASAALAVAAALVGSVSRAPSVPGPGEGVGPGLGRGEAETERGQDRHRAARSLEVVAAAPAAAAPPVGLQIVRQAQQLLPAEVLALGGPVPALPLPRRVGPMPPPAAAPRDLPTVA